MSDLAHISVVHKPPKFMGLNFNNQLNDESDRFSRIETTMRISEDPNLKHNMDFNGKISIVILGLQLFQINIRIKFCGPAYSQIFTDFIVLKIIPISLFTSSAIISTGPLTHRLVLHFHSGSSILDRIFAFYAKKSVNYDVSDLHDLVKLKNS